MIEDLEDLNLSYEDTTEQVESKIKEKLGLGFSDMIDYLSPIVQERADQFVEGIINAAPLGDYSKILEDKQEIAAFIKNEAYKKEHWEFYSLGKLKAKDGLIKFVFHNNAIDDGETFEGYVVVNFNGKIKHAFAQGTD